jgi:hypothetical protein
VGLKLVAAGAGYQDFMVLGMNAFFHFSLTISDTLSPERPKVNRLVYHGFAWCQAGIWKPGTLPYFISKIPGQELGGVPGFPPKQLRPLAHARGSERSGPGEFEKRTLV